MAGVNLMPDESQQVATASLPAGSLPNIMTMPLPAAIEAYTPRFAQALPDHIPLERYKRALHTALSKNPDLVSADRRSLFNACVQCALDGLYPDGREAALVVFKGQVAYMPMIIGIRKRMRNSGGVLSAIAEVVYRNDHFRYVKGENPHIEHEPPDLDKERGDPVGAYAIIKLSNGETLREVMGVHEIERIRAFSRNAVSKSGHDSPWETSWGEMARKTVLRRCSKAAPMDSEVERMLAHDFGEEAEELQQIPARPRREDFESRSVAASTAEFDSADAGSSPAGAANEDIPLYEVVNCDGESTPCTADTVEENMMAVFAEAQKRGRGAIEAAVENNDHVINEMEEIARTATTIRLAREIGVLRSYLDRSKEDASEDDVPAPDLQQRLAEHLKGEPQLADTKLNKEGSDWETYSAKLLETIPLVSDPAQFARCRLSRDMNRLRTAGEAQKERWQKINVAMGDRERFLSKKARREVDDHANTDSG